jgi:hypothetical protein
VAKCQAQSLFGIASGVTRASSLTSRAGFPACAFFGSRQGCLCYVILAPKITPKALCVESTIYHLLSAICHPPSPISHLPSTIYHLLSAICYPPTPDVALAQPPQHQKKWN